MDTLSIETMLAPLDHLQPQHRIGDVESRLRVVAASLNGIDPLRREAIKSGATSKLKAAKVPGAKQLVEAALSGDRQAATGQGSAVAFEEPELWPDPVSGAELFDTLERCYGDRVILPTGGAIALALWTVHTYAVGVADTSPYLVLTSPEPRCGKTTTLAIAGALCYRPLSSSNITEAALYRIVEQAEPTLIIDEADTFLRENYAFSGILNSGHSRTTAFVVRCVGDTAEPRRFKTFGPKLIALIGRLPAASTADRSILVRMRRRLPAELVQRVDTRRLYTDLAVPLAPGVAGSENGRLCPGAGTHEGGERCRRGLMLPLLRANHSRARLYWTWRGSDARRCGYLVGFFERLPRRI